MAFDQDTRNKLQRFVSDVRALLTEEFTRQLQEDYGMDPDTGEVSSLSKLAHLDDARRETARLLRETLEHYKAATPSGNNGEVLDRIVREQAFTVLNRLCAVRMAEARGIIIESIGTGYNSKGFQLYSRLAKTAFGEIGEAYRSYLFSVFDEFAVDLPVLFDRYSPLGRLFPKPEKLISGNPTKPGLIEMMNSEEIGPLWAEDETIGWIYQYFNSTEERRQMRRESSAPRNSRELAVRNQFFTPRYVVEFLTDNTLGRIWYEMTRGETILKEACHYLVRRPKEIFLAEGEEAPVEETPSEDLSQEKLLNEPVYIPYRPIKDPREIILLDPACGSMHFGLYAFDLFEQIYKEAWEWEEKYGKDALRRSKYLKPLQETYSDSDEFLRDVPRLIIEYNIHGIDIDSRAVQIAGLSLWLRAQRSWKEQEVNPVERPQIRRSNVVCAEPMPGEKEFLEEFIKEHFTTDPEHKLLGQLIHRVFDAMELAGEAGSLLKIEEEISDVVAEAKREWLSKPQVPLFNEIATPVQEELGFDVSGISDETFWDEAEERIYAALKKYAEKADNGGYRRRLFSEDAARGFAFIGVCRKRYDVVVMNPPFGEFSKAWKDQAREAYPNSYNDILAAFVDSFLHRLHGYGRLGAITSRTCFFLTSFKNWRKAVLTDAALSVVADLGQGVMDNAMVEAAAYVIERARPVNTIPFFRAIIERDRESVINSCVKAFNSGCSDSHLLLANQEAFTRLPDSPFVYWVTEEDLSVFGRYPLFQEVAGDVRVGLQTGDDFRFCRTVWEVAPEDTQFVYFPPNDDKSCRFDDPNVQAYFRRRLHGTPRWAFHVKSGVSQPWYSPITLKVNWYKDGSELRNFIDDKGKPRSYLRSVDFYYRPGFSWTLRAVRFYPYVIPGNCIPSVSRYMAFPAQGGEYTALGVSASRVASAFMRFYGEKFEWPKFLVEHLKMLPWPELDNGTIQYLHKHITAEVKLRRQAYQNHEPFHEFLLPVKIQDFSNAGQSLAFDPTSLLGDEGERKVERSYGFDTVAAARVERDLLEALAFQQGDSFADESAEGQEQEDDVDFLLDYSEETQISATISYTIGLTFGRWDIRYATGEKQAPELPDPFAPLPVCPPGMLQNEQGLPITKEDVERLKEEGCWDYPIEIPWDGIIVDDSDHPLDIERRVREVIEIIWKERAEDIEHEACEILGVNSLGEYFCKPTGFFDDHLKRYSKSRRQAPIYWPLSTASGAYTLWLYYHRLTDQTLYICINDFVEPKLKQVMETSNELRRKEKRNSQEENELERLEDLEAELKDFRDELLRVARFWKPNLNDGVQITAAPFWKLFGLTRWQSRLKSTWERMERGEYDWAHLAYSIWPERVLREAQKDRSIAIAHDLEDELWEEMAKGVRRKWVSKKLSEEEIQKVLEEKTGR